MEGIACLTKPKSQLRPLRFLCLELASSSLSAYTTDGGRFKRREILTAHARSKNFAERGGDAVWPK